MAGPPAQAERVVRVFETGMMFTARGDGSSTGQAG